MSNKVNKWGSKSLKVRSELDPRLQKIVDEVLKHIDVSLTTGHRTKEEQDALYPKFTKVKWPNSKHNKYPALAVDLQPWPYPKDERELWAALGFIAGLATVIAEKDGVELRWGGDWDRDGDVTDNDFDDLFHLEIVE